MRKKFLQLCRRLRYRSNAIYTWLWRSSLKSCGDGVRLDFPLLLNEPGSISIGANSVIYPRTWINAVSEWAGTKYHGQIDIGERVIINFGVQISAANSIVIEDGVAISSGSVIVDHIHDHSHLDSSIYRAPISKPLPVRIGKGSFLGVHCVIGPGVQIGEHAVVAANAVVTRDVPSYCMAIGNPARVVRFHDPERNNVPVAELAGTERA
jgi:acetyltransferase-like isoleucine patch superfamily enzyme